MLYDSTDLINYVDQTSPIPITEQLEQLYANTVIARTDYRGGLVLMFGDGNFGKRLTSSSEVQVTYLKTQGLSGQINRATDLGTYLVGEDETTAVAVNFVVSSRIQGGTNEDSIDKIR